MKAKDKARELMQKVYDLDKHNKTTQSRCKQIALLCVDELIKNAAWKNESYYKEVKQEIEKL